jgi:hypothetical protein
VNPREKIVEKISVDWWQAPVFAVDKEGFAITDLQPGDIEVRVDKKIIGNFTLHKRTFGVSDVDEDYGEEFDEEPEQEEQSQQPSIAPAKKTVILLFDVAMSNQTSTRRAKGIARQIVWDAEEDTRFIVMTIEPFAGLTYIGGSDPSGNKDNLLKLVAEKVIEKGNPRMVRQSNYILQNYHLIRWAASARMSNEMRRRIAVFFSAFDALHLYLNSIQDNKFIYLFSEGIPSSALENIRSAATTYNESVKQVAKNLGRCGAVLFLVNAMGVDQYTTSATTAYQTGGELFDFSSPLAGETFLKYLAQESSGNYMEGELSKIGRKIETFNRAYYEISFPDTPDLKGTSHNIRVKSKRKGVKVYSPRSLAKPSPYKEMSDMEKNLVALNLINQQALITEKVRAFNAAVDRVKKNKKKVVYQLNIPSDYLNKSMDVYKYWVVDAKGIIHSEKQAMVIPGKKLKIEFALKDLEKEAGDAEIKTYFAMIDGGTEPPGAIVHGTGVYPEHPEIASLLEKQEHETRKKRKTDDIDAGELTAILAGAAGYCDKLKGSALHFICQEEIVVNRKPLTAAGKIDPHISTADLKKRPDNALETIRRKAYERAYKHVFSYRLIKKGRDIKEEREWLSSKDNKQVNREEVAKTSAFFSEKPIFAPITLLDRRRQDKYDYRFIRYDKLNGRPAAVIEAMPRDAEKNSTIYGDIWIDSEDFSVLKIEADPRSILGYKSLKELARKLRTKLLLSLEIEFGKARSGIRFPTQVKMMEKYKGGRIISQHRGPKGWERTITLFNYNDYQFFSVEVDVTVHGE